MPPRGVAERVRDILGAVERIQTYTGALTYEQFCADQKTVEAVQLNFIIIGEAARSIPDDVTAEHPDIPWKEMRGLRNIVVHGYFGVSVSVLWQTVSTDLPSIVGPLEALLAEFPGPTD